MGLNKVFLIGNCGQDPEVKHLQSGNVTATLKVATTERYNDKNGETKEITEWHSVDLWRTNATFAEQFIRKGSQVYVEGKIRTRSWDDQRGVKHYATEIQADNIQILGNRQTDEGQVTRAAAQVAAQQRGQTTEEMLGDIRDRRSQQQPQPQRYDNGSDDLPF